MSADLEPPLALVEGFAPATRDQWKALVDGVLGKGLSDPDRAALDERFDKALVTRTYDGLRIEPLYDAGDAGRLPDSGLPGFPPFVRGRTVLGATVDGWDICQRVESGPDGSPAGTAQEELEGGASSVWLGLSGPEVDAGALDATLSGVLLELVSVRLDAGPRTAEAAAALVELWADRGVGPGEARASLGFDPIGWAATATTSSEVEGWTDQAADWARRCADRYPGVRSMCADGLPFHGAGASDAEELGATLAAGLAYVRALAAAGLGVDAALSQLELRVAATADQFSTIAKLRAARRLWGRVGEVLGAAPEVRVPPVHAVTSPAMLSVYDPWVNLLRTTVACFAAGVGGADAVTVLPYDHFSAGPGSSLLGRRLARNVHALLLEESHVASVLDAAGGSWYVESLTDGLATKAWEWFQAIEAAGGLAAALANGVVSDRIDATWAARSARLATGSDPLTGVSEFPNVDETPPDPDTLDAALASEVPGVALPFRRWPAAFEAQRARADRHTRQEGQRPTVLLATLGTPAAFTTRATFAANLFGVAGIRSIPLREPPTVDGWSGALVEHGARLACICSDDATYADLAESTARKLKEAGAARVYLAGRPGDARQAWEDAGVDEFVHLGVNRLDVLGRALDAAGVR